MFLKNKLDKVICGQTVCDLLLIQSHGGWEKGPVLSCVFSAEPLKKSFCYETMTHSLMVHD